MMVATYDGVPWEDLALRLGAPRLECVPAVGSTLDVLHERAAQGAPEGTAVLADTQTRGRGRHGRVWESPPGTGIWLAWLLRPACAPLTGVLSLRAGLVVAEALERLGVPVRMKWPNDVMVRDRKLAGILCEARELRRERWVAVGIGVNVHGPLPAAVAQCGIALDSCLPAVTRCAVLAALLPLLGRLDAAGELTEIERRAFAGIDWLRGRTVAEPVSGTACGVAADGALLVATEQGMRRVTAGTVRAA